VVLRQRMTAEIAILNKEAIALASDSAVTIMGDSSPKIFTSANKLFSLSKYQPVGIMLYQNASFMGIPWEVIIKIYRNKLGSTKFDRLEDYSNNFITFLSCNNPLIPNQVQEQFMVETILDYFYYVRMEIIKALEAKMVKEKELVEESIREVVSRVIKEHHDLWEQAAYIPSIPEDYSKETRLKYFDMIKNLVQDTFEKLPITDDIQEYLIQIACNLFSKFPDNVQNPSFSGIVIAGFGEMDTFPSLDEFLMEGIVNNRLKYKKRRSVRIDFKTNASIMPFAQREMVDTFMQGVDPDYLNMEEGFLNDIFDNYATAVSRSLTKYPSEEQEQFKLNLVAAGREILADFKNKLQAHRNEKYAQPISQVVSFLPKDELAAMAESLVNLTSFKRKVTMESETVAGPIDVALITKGDGFIWIKRKHYFKAELNPQFLANYYRGGRDECANKI
jgi:hypothetical protein